MERGFKKKSNIKESQLASLPDPFQDKKPRGSLDDKPLPNVKICLDCNSRVSDKSLECQNCGSKKLQIIGIQPRTPNPKGNSFSPKQLNNTPEYIQKGVAIASSDDNYDFLFNSNSDNKLIEAKKKQYKSEEFKMLISPPVDEDIENSDINEDIEQSANDLAIDG